jgi:ADP-heptose:LPS heptosyltransferase
MRNLKGKKNKTKVLFSRTKRGVGDLIMMLRAIELARVANPNLIIGVQTKYPEILSSHPAIDAVFDENENIAADLIINQNDYCANYEQYTDFVAKSRHELFCENTSKSLETYGLNPIQWDYQPATLWVLDVIEQWAKSFVINTCAEKIPIGVFGKSDDDWRTWQDLLSLIQMLAANDKFSLFYFDTQNSIQISHVNSIVGYSLDKVIALAAHMKIIISHDSAGVHIAGSLGIPIYGIFGPTDPLQRIAFYQDASWALIKCPLHPCWYEYCEQQFCFKKLNPRKIYKQIYRKISQNINVISRLGKSHKDQRRKESFFQLQSELFLPSSKSENKQEKIVIIRMRGIGDVLMSWFGLEILREQNPEAHISYVTSVSCAKLFNGQEDLVDKVIAINWDYQPVGIPDLPREVLDIPHDRIIDLTNRVDFHDTIEKSLGDRELLHTSPRVNNLARLMGVKINNSLAIRNINIPQDFQEYADNIAAIFGDKLLISCQLDAKGLTRNWDIERWIQLSRLLVNDGYGIIWFSVTPEHADISVDGVLNLSCQTTLLQAVALMSKCKHAISTCSASIHIAARLKNVIPVGIYGSTNYKLLGAYYNDLIPITNYKLPCAPCADWGHECLSKSGAPWCINQISPYMVYDAI